MSLRGRGLGAVFAASILLGTTWEPSGVASAAAPDAADAFFEEQVWAKVGERTCLNCHRADGDASESDFLLRDAQFDPDLLRQNRDAFARMAAKRSRGTSRLLAKSSGGLNHGGGPQLKADSTGYRILEEFVRRLDGRSEGKPSAEPAPSPFFQGVEMASPRRLLRRVTLSLAGRLPRTDELAAVDQGGLDAMGPLLDALLKEDAFYERLKEGFNDIFLTFGYDGVAEEIFSYDHFPTRLWYQKHEFPNLTEEERKRARGNLATDYRKAMLQEPFRLIEFIVRNDLPFTQIVTADYIMVSPYTARGYGIFEAVRHLFKNPDDPFEYIPARLPALKARNGKVQESPDGLYPHAGLLTMFQYLTRYRTTETNRNRLRARMYFQHFLGIDVLQLAPRVTDSAAVSTKFATPTLEAPDCVVCHKVIDPVAGLFQDYFKETGDYGPRKGGWFTDMFAPGREGRDLPREDRWRALPWLGEQTAKDPRFAAAMVEHVWYILTGRKLLLPPIDVDDPHFTPKRRAYREQRQAIQKIAARFAKTGFNLKQVFKDLIASPFYRADGLAEAASRPARRAELSDVGLVRLLAPEQLERKLEAIFGTRWGRLSEQNRSMAILYGAIDSKEVTERMSDPSGAMGAIQRLMANDVASKNVPADFALEPGRRRLFPGVELADVPGAPETDLKLRRAVARLHELLLGRDHGVDHPEVERTWGLFTGILEEARVRGEKKSDDPHYTRRAWRAVVTYLLRTDDFLYE